jgi:hypothetical protein
MNGEEYPHPRTPATPAPGGMGNRYCKLERRKRGLAPNRSADSVPVPLSAARAGGYAASFVHQGAFASPLLA